MKRSTTEAGYRRERARQFYRVVCLGRRDWTPVVRGASHYHEVLCGFYAHPRIAWAKCWARERRFPNFRFSVFATDAAESKGK